LVVLHGGAHLPLEEQSTRIASHRSRLSRIRESRYEKEREP
jgi:hypothetical protein